MDVKQRMRHEAVDRIVSTATSVSVEAKDMGRLAVMAREPGQLFGLEQQLARLRKAMEIIAEQTATLRVLEKL